MSTGLNRRQARALPFLVTARTFEGGCQAAGISTSCGYLWLKQAAFKDELEEARDTLVDEALTRLKTNVGKAIDSLVALSEDEDKDTRRLSCCKVIEFYLKLREIDEIEGRLSRIEAILEKRGLNESRKED